MKAEPFVDAIHRPELQRWLIRHDLAPLLVDSLPRIGFVVDGVGAGFLRVCEGSYGLIDGYITNPVADKVDRNAALELITDSLIRAAKAMNIQRILAFTTDASVITRAKKHGFAQLPHVFLVREIK